MPRTRLALLPMALAACHSYEALDGVSTWHVTDDDGTVLEVGLALDTAAMDLDRHGLVRVPFDDAVRDQLGIDHASVGFGPKGHGPPGRFNVPHFDLHFMRLSEDDELAIDCKKDPQPSQSRIPKGYVVNTKKVPFGSCVPEMGAHAELEATARGKMESWNMIVGFADGEVVFFEPMLHADVVLGGESVDAEFPLPKVLDGDGLWPTRFLGSEDPETGEYRASLVEFVAIE